MSISGSLFPGITRTWFVVGVFWCPHAQHPCVGTKPPQVAPPFAPGRRCPCRLRGAYNGLSRYRLISFTGHAWILVA